MSCKISRSNVTVSLIQYASDKLEATGSFKSKGGNKLSVENRDNYQEHIDSINQEFQDNIAAEDDQGDVIIYPSEELVNDYLPEITLTSEQEIALQEVKQKYGEKTVQEEQGELKIKVQAKKPTASQHKKVRGTQEAKAWALSFLRNTGVVVQKVNDIRIGGERLGADAVALPLRSLVMYTQDSAIQLSEEAMHIAVELLSQKEPKIFQQLMEEIGDTEIYQEVLEEYGQDTHYQNKDGSPNTEKLKREAIGKALSQEIVYGTKTPKVETWWSKITSFLKNLFGDSGQRVLQSTRAMEAILSNSLGTVRNTLLQNSDYLASQGVPTENIEDVIRLASSNLSNEELSASLYDLVPELVFKKSASNKAKEVLQGIKEKVTTTGTLNEEVALRSQLNNTPDQQKIRDKILNRRESKAGKSIRRALHKFIDKDGFLDNSKLPDNELESNILQRLVERESGTIFSIDQTVQNAKGEQYISDLVAISPLGEVSIFNFQEVSEGITGPERTAFRHLLDKQVAAIKTPEITLDRTRVIPINTTTDKAGVVQIQIGNTQVQNEDQDFLLPIPSQTESTKIPKLDEFLTKLRNAMSTISSTGKNMSPIAENQKRKELSTLGKAIRYLQVKKDIEPLLGQSRALIRKMEELVDKYDLEVKGSTLSTEARKEFADELNLLLLLADTYIKIPSTLNNLAKEDTDFAISAKRFNLIKDKLIETSEELADRNRDFIAALGESVGVTGVLDSERVVNRLHRSMRALSQQQPATIRVLYKLLNPIWHRVDLHMAEKVEGISKLKDNFEKWRNQRGLSYNKALDFLIQKDKHQLIDKYNKEFYKNLTRAKEEGDVTWVRKNIDLKEYNEWFTLYRDALFQEIENTTYNSYDVEKDQEIKESQKENFLNTYDLSRGISKFNTQVIKYPSNSWISQEYKTLEKAENKPLLDLYLSFQDVNEKLVELGVIQQYQARTFLPFARKDFVEKITLGGKVRLMEGTLSTLTKTAEDTTFGKIDPETGQVKNEIPFYYLDDFAPMREDGSRDYSNMSQDIFNLLYLIESQAVKYEGLTSIESAANLLLRVEESKQALATSLTGKRIEGAPTIANVQNTTLLQNFISGTVYGQRDIGEGWDMKLWTYSNKAAKKINKFLGREVFSEEYDGQSITVSQTVDALNRFYTLKVLGLNIPVSVANFFGNNFQAFLNAGNIMSKKDLAIAESVALQGVVKTKGDNMLLGAINWLSPLVEGADNVRKARQLKMSKLNHYSFAEALMSVHRVTDMPVQWAIAGAVMMNTMVLDGKLVNIRQHVKAKPEYKDLYSLSLPQSARKALQKKLEQEIQDLKDTQSIPKIAKIENDLFTIPGIERNSETVAQLRELIQQTSRNATGMGNQDDMRLYQGNFLFRSLMMFKSWMPRQVDNRIGEFRHVEGTDSFEWGRMAVSWNLLKKGFLKSFSNFYGVASLNDRGIELIMDEYNNMKNKYEFENPGKEFKLTENQFIELYQRQIKGQLQETLILLTLMGMLMSAMHFAAGDDDDPEIRGFWRYSARLVDKTFNELKFFYSPFEWKNLANGNMLPALGVMDDAYNIVKHISMEGFGYAMGDEELSDKAKPLKYVIKALPMSRWATPYIALILNEESQRETGLTVANEVDPYQGR